MWLIDLPISTIPIYIYILLWETSEIKLTIKCDEFQLQKPKTFFFSDSQSVKSLSLSVPSSLVLRTRVSRLHGLQN